MAASCRTPRTSSPSTVIVPVSAVVRPATRLSSVDLPLPIAPTTETNDPRSTSSRTFRSTCRTPPGAAKDFDRSRTSMNANLTPCERLTSRDSLRGPQLRLGHPHQPVEREADDADGDDGEED